MDRPQCIAICSKSMIASVNTQLLRNLLYGHPHANRYHGSALIWYVWSKGIVEPICRQVTHVHYKRIEGASLDKFSQTKGTN